MRVLRKSTVRPCPSVTRPSSKTCKRTLKTSGWAFSISSKRMTDRAGANRLGQGAAFVRSRHSLEERRWREPNVSPYIRTYRSRHERGFIVEQKLRESLGELGLADPGRTRNMNEPIGRWGSCRPARARRTAVETAATASAWPTTRRASASSIFKSLSRSPSSILSTGMPVQRETICATWLAVTASSTRTPPRSASVAASFLSRSGMTP